MRDKGEGGWEMEEMEVEIWGRGRQGDGEIEAGGWRLGGGGEGCWDMGERGAGRWRLGGEGGWE